MTRIILALLLMFAMSCNSYKELQHHTNTTTTIEQIKEELRDSLSSKLTSLIGTMDVELSDIVISLPSPDPIPSARGQPKSISIGKAMVKATTELASEQIVETRITTSDSTDCTTDTASIHNSLIDTKAISLADWGIGIIISVLGLFFFFKVIIRKL